MENDPKVMSVIELLLTWKKRSPMKSIIKLFYFINFISHQNPAFTIQICYGICTGLRELETTRPLTAGHIRSATIFELKLNVSEIIS